MTTVYFVRHAKTSYSSDDRNRQLDPKGIKEIENINNVFNDVDLDVIYSSPYVRVLDTIRDISVQKNLEIITNENLREREIKIYIEDFIGETTKQWEDFDYAPKGTETLRTVQDRGIEVILDVLSSHTDKNIMVGTHGTFLTTMLNYFDDSIDFEFWKELRMPDIVECKFDKLKLVEMRKVSF